MTSKIWMAAGVVALSIALLGPGTYNGFRFMSMTGSAHLALLASLIIFVSFWIPSRGAKKEDGNK